VEEHVESCESCKTEFENMQRTDNFPIDNNGSPLKKIKSSLHRNKMIAIALSVLIALTFVFIIIGQITSPEYFQYKENMVSVTSFENGNVALRFGSEVSGYDLSYRLSEDKLGYVYEIATWDSIWNRLTGKQIETEIILNPDEEIIKSVYYYSNDGTEDILIYGEDLTPGGGIITLPRLFLAAYLMIAVIIIILGAIVMIVLRKKEKGRIITLYITLLPVAYILGHITAMGFKTVSYSPVHDLFTILLVMTPIYFVIAVLLKKLIQFFSSRWKKH